MKVVTADKKEPRFGPEDIAAFADAIRIHYVDHRDSIDADIRERIDNLPSRYIILKETDPSRIALMTDTVGYIWRKITGKTLSAMEKPSSSRGEGQLDGCYWMLPGGLLISGINHYSTAKRHREVVCSLLGINPFLFEHKLGGSPDDLIKLVIANGGIRMLVKRNKSTVFMQTNQASWGWAKKKAERLAHRKKFVKIVDLDSPYKGWSSGIALRIN